ncbi:helix-turn-helix domain-containing protein [Streptomyces sp. SYP-A7185]|uniref:helix-turn-helix domain-containing protein n=1 Tax=Streptomyces sp. SYP-A7185 TaxID=3040076 RepID=UPI0038F65520
MTPSRAGRARDGARPAPAPPSTAPVPPAAPAPPDASVPHVSAVSPGEDATFGAARRLTHAAGRSGAELIAEAAALTDGWAALVGPLAGAVHSHPPAAAPLAVRAAAHPRAHPQLTVQQVADAALVLGPGEATPAERVALIARLTADLLLMRARQADATRGAEQRVHGAALRLLLSGRYRLALDVLGGDTAPYATHATHATVYRLAGSNAPAAHQALWRAAYPGVSVDGTRTLIGRDGEELAFVALHGDRGDQSATPSLLARIAERYHLAAGAADAAPLDMFPTAWAEAGTVRGGAAVGRLAPTAGLGAHGLLRVVPAARLTAWSAAVLRPLDHQRRRTLEVWLRSGSAQAAAPALGVSEGTVRSRLRAIAALLAADLDHPTVQAQLLLALRAPAPPGPAVSAETAESAVSAESAASARLAASPLPSGLLGPAEAERWAADLFAPLDIRLRTALRCWLAQRGRTAPAAAELGLHRTTLTAWLHKCGRLLGVDLASVTVRAELHLAAETVATPEEAAAALPRRGGRTYREPRPRLP